MTRVTELWVKPCGVAVEGLFYPEKPDLSLQEWRAEAEAHAAKLWGAIGERRALLAQKSINPTLHALRTKPRGYGKRRVHWQATTECGQMMLQGEWWHWHDGPLRDTTCLVCRKVVRERREMELEIGVDADEGMDAYDQEQIEEMWRIQAEWHQPDPVASNWVGEGVT